MTIICYYYIIMTILIYIYDKLSIETLFLCSYLCTIFSRCTNRHKAL